MAKLDIKKSFKDKKFRYGGYATLITTIVLAILLVVNLVATKVDYKFDMTKNKLYSLSDQTNKILDNLKQNVTIYAFYESGKENETVKEYLNKYSTRTGKISVQYKDPTKYPQFAQQFSKDGTQISDGTVVVSSGSRYKVITEDQMVNYSTDQSGNPTPDSLAIEQRLTGGIMYVTTDKSPIVYNLQGHQEDALPSEITTEIETENYTLKDLSLVTKDASLQDGTILLIDSPKRDLSSDELAKIKDFISKGGKMMYLSDIIQDNLPNFKELLAYVGVSVQNAPIVEGSAQNVASNPLYLLPELQSHDITNPIISAKLPVIMPVAQGIDILDVKKDSLDIAPLLVTTNDSWGKKNLNTTTLEKEAGDTQGPFNVAVAITNKSSDGNTAKDGRIVVTGTSKFTDSSIITASNRANVDFFMNSLNWIEGSTDNISIEPKSIVAESLNISQFQALFTSGVLVIVIPGIVLVAGIVVWLRRRHQ